MRNLLIRDLTVADAAHLSTWLNEQPPAHTQYFRPFPFDSKTLDQMLDHAQEDRYIGFFAGRRQSLAALLLVRGWDAGYEVPSYGILVDHNHLRCGWGKLSVAVAEQVARLMGATKLMLKVHPDNAPALQLYAATGWDYVRPDPQSDTMIFEKML